MTLYGCCYDYDRVVEGFKRSIRRSKSRRCSGSGNQLATRMLAERRRPKKYLPDVVSAGANTIHDALYKAHVLGADQAGVASSRGQDQSKWFEGEHRYIDPEKRYILPSWPIPSQGQVIYNLKQVSPGEVQILLGSRRSKVERKDGLARSDQLRHGRHAAVPLFSPRARSAVSQRNFYGEMQVTVSRDARQMTDWLSAGKFALCIRCNAGSEVGKAVQQKLPIRLSRYRGLEGGRQARSAAGGTLGILTARLIPTRRRCSSTGFFRARPDRAAKLGRPDAHNSRRNDIPKRRRRRFQPLGAGKKYFDLAKPEYQDLTPIFKLVREVLPQK